MYLAIGARFEQLHISVSHDQPEYSRLGIGRIAT